MSGFWKKTTWWWEKTELGFAWSGFEWLLAMKVQSKEMSDH